MNIYNYLEKDHRHLSEWMEKLIACRSNAHRKSLFDEIKQELIQHMDAKEATFYAVLKRHPYTRSLMDQAAENHQEINQYISKLSRLSVGSDRWLETFGEFKHAIDQHMKREEVEIFKKAQQILSRQASVELAVEMLELKRNPPQSSLAA